MYDSRYDAAQIRRDAGLLMTHGTIVVVLHTLVGAAVGLGAGGLFGLALGNSLIGALVGLVAGGVLGYLWGESRAVLLRLQAQLALCQVAIEENTRAGRLALASAVREPGPAPTLDRTPASAPATGAAPGRGSFRWEAEDPGSGHACPSCGRRYPLALANCPGCGRPNEARDTGGPPSAG